MSYDARNNEQALHHRQQPTHSTPPHYNAPVQSQANSEQPKKALTKKERAAIQIKFITNAATQVELSETKDEVPTLHFEQTTVKKVSGSKKCDWANKIIFHLSPNTELLQFIDFLTNRIAQPEVMFKYHGQQNNKSMRLTKNKDGSLMVGLSFGSKHLSGNIQPTGVAQILTLAYKAYADRFNISIVDAISLLNKSPVAEIPKG